MRSAEVPDDPVHLHQQRGVAEPLALYLRVTRFTVIERQPCPAKRAAQARLSSGLNLSKRSGDGVVVRLVEDVQHRRVYRTRQGDEERPHPGHCRMRDSGEASVIVETTRDHRDADGRPLEARHDRFVATQHVDVASIADVPLSSLPTAADRLGGLGDQSLSSRAAVRRHSAVWSVDQGC